MREPTLKVAETFYSIQGEGYWTGTPAYFIRLAGCSVGCAWCDTDYRKRDDLTVKNILDAAKESKPRHFVVTGGEPIDQDLGPLVAGIKGRFPGALVQLETAGTREVAAPFDWITVSPKASPELLLQRRGNECKVVFAWPVAWYPKFLAMDFQHFFMQPLALGATTNAEKVVEYVKDHPRWRLSTQVHKTLGIR